MSAAQEESPSEVGIFVNGEALRSRARSLADLLGELGYGDVKVATAINGNFVAATQRGETPLRNNDQVEVVAPRQGG